MDYGKYVIVEVMGHEIAILCDKTIEHYTIAGQMRVISAGFFEVKGKESENDQNDIEICVFGRSITLDKVSRPEDEKIIKLVLRKLI